MPYDQTFLDHDLTAPAAPGTDAVLLDYMHFSLALNADRRLAWWVAWNIDGQSLFIGDGISRDGENFRLDDRAPAQAQTGEAVYADNRLDRGHLARRADLLWGTLADAKQANSDSFFFTNISPQMDDFNQSSRGGVWGELENAVLDLDDLTDRRLTLFAGPVLAADDPNYRDLVQLPRQHWKVVVYRRDPAADAETAVPDIRAKLFVLAQDLNPDAAEFLDEFKTYEVTLAELEERTGLTFPSLASIATEETVEPAGQVSLRARLIETLADIHW